MGGGGADEERRHNSRSREQCPSLPGDMAVSRVRVEGGGRCGGDDDQACRGGRGRRAGRSVPEPPERCHRRRARRPAATRRCPHACHRRSAPRPCRRARRRYGDGSGGPGCAPSPRSSAPPARTSGVRPVRRSGPFPDRPVRRTWHGKGRGALAGAKPVRGTTGRGGRRAVDTDADQLPLGRGKLLGRLGEQGHRLAPGDQPGTVRGELAVRLEVERPRDTSLGESDAVAQIHHPLPRRESHCDVVGIGDGRRGQVHRGRAGRVGRPHVRIARRGVAPRDRAAPRYR